jgi:AcrR family transcriptional regulator
VTEAPPSRRRRLRDETTAEIKAVALGLMRSGGPGAITLRAIAREMGMTAGAIYGYFPTRDDLLGALIGEVSTALVDAVEAARDARPRDDPGGRLLAWAEAFRVWSLANPEGFRLVYGEPVPGYAPPPGGPAAEAERRACAGLTELVAAAWPTAAAVQSGGFAWSDFSPELVAEVRGAFPDLPPDGVAVALRCWGRMHGLVALEVHGHLAGQTTSAGALYRAEMLDMLRSLGLPPRA